MGREIFTLTPFTGKQLRSALGRLKSMGIGVTVTSTRRTRQEQTDLFRRFQAGETAFPVAVPGTSRHEQGLAVDLVPESPACLQTVVQVMTSFGFRWAGPADSVHFDMFPFSVSAGEDPFEETTFGQVTQGFAVLPEDFQFF